jgi:Methyltransferase TRM13
LGNIRIFFSAEHVGCIPDSIKYHKLLKSTLEKLQESRGSFRHVTQNSSILQNMEEAGLLASEGSKTFVEFGSGRGDF